MSKLYEKALEIATKAHEGQKRWNGEPYITHPVAVAAAIGIGFDDESAAVALLHDVVEDTSVTLDEIEALLPADSDIDYIMQAIAAITHYKEDSYASYIYELSYNRCATAVKIADLKHNLSDLKPGQRRDKYELALMYLESM